MKKTASSESNNKEESDLVPKGEEEESALLSESSIQSSIHYSSGSDILLTKESVYKDVEVHEYIVNKTVGYLTDD